MDYPKALMTMYDKDSDFVLRSLAANYTLSLEQMVYVMLQRSDMDRPMKHLVSKAFLQTYDIDIQTSRRYIVPIPGEQPVYMYEPADSRVDAFPSYKQMIYLTKAKMRKIEDMVTQVKTKTGLSPTLTGIQTDDGSKYWRMDDAVMIDRSVSTFDLVYILQKIFVESYLDKSTAMREKTIGNLALKFLNLFAEVPEPADIDALETMSSEELYAVFDAAFRMFVDIMFVLVPTFSLTEIVTITKVYQQNMRKPDFLSALSQVDQSLTDKVRSLDATTSMRLLTICKTGRLSYTPTIIL